MLIEVTEKEAIGIYTQRFYREKRNWKQGVFMGVSLTVTIGAYLAMPENLNQWLSISPLALMFPMIYWTIKLSHESGKYARNQLGEAVCGLN